MDDGYCNDCGKTCKSTALNQIMGQYICDDCVFMRRLFERCMDECFSLTIPQFRDKTRIAGLVL